MSHCRSCTGFSKPIRFVDPDTMVRNPPCPGCGHEEDIARLTADLDEKTRLLDEAHRALREKCADLAAARDEVQKIVDAERTEQARLIDERDMAKAALATARAEEREFLAAEQDRLVDEIADVKVIHRWHLEKFPAFIRSCGKRGAR